MVITVTKMTFHKNPPKEIYYRYYKKFDQDLFREELAEKLYGCDSCYDTFEEIFINVLNKHAPLKKKFLRANHASYMTKTLSLTTLSLAISLISVRQITEEKLSLVSLQFSFTSSTMVLTFFK